MKILLVYYHFEVCGGRYYLDAFKRLGVDVRHIGQQMSVRDAWGLQTPVPEKYAHKPDAGIEAYPEDGIEDFDIFWDDWKPDLILVCDSMLAGRKWRHAIYDDIPHAVIAIDNHVRDYDGDWTHQFLAHYHGPAYPVDPARKDHSWLPCAADSQLFTPSPIAWRDREFDVCMIGVMYPKRVEVINALRDAGLSVRAETGLLYEEYRDAYWNARISLCVSAAGDVAQRLFETGRMGCAVMTDPLFDIADSATCAALKLNGRIEYANPKESVLVARELLGGIGERFKIGGVMEQQPEIVLGQQASALLAESCKPHTWEARAQVIVDWYEREYGKVTSVEEKLIREDAVVQVDYGEKVGMVSVQLSDFQDTVKALEQGTNEPADLQPAILYTRPEPEKSAGTTAQQAFENAKLLSEALNAPPVGTVNEEGYLAVDLSNFPERKPFLNLGCGRTHLPSERPAHHVLVPEAMYQGETWVNVDRVSNVGADCVFDLFAYPWPLESDSYDGALLSHLCEHIPHEIKSSKMIVSWRDDLPDFLKKDFEDQRRIFNIQDGWFAFFAELYRVLTPGAEVHILSPHARSDGAIADPTHTRYLLPDSFTHSMVPDPDAPFEYATGGIHFEVVDYRPGLNPEYVHMLGLPSDPTDVQQAKRVQIDHLARTQNNVCPEFYVRLKVVK